MEIRTHIYGLLFLVLLFTGCRPSTRETQEGVRHYDVEYNFLVTADSLVLQEERPMHLLIVPENVDSFVLYKDDPIVVAQIEIIPEDSIDSVWVKVARDQMTQGWVHESTLLEAVVPDDPISQGIYFFSDLHVRVALAFCFITLGAGIVRRVRNEGEYPLVHVRDIASPYPTLLCLAFASATVLYTSIQVFVPDLWATFYYHPTLNPFGQPTMLALFLALAWFIVILFIASVDDLRRCLPAVGGIQYMLSLMAVLGGIYILFSIATQYFVGHVILMAYIAFAIVRYWQRHRANVRCRHCGAPLHEHGLCPKCGKES